MPPVMEYLLDVTALVLMVVYYGVLMVRGSQLFRLACGNLRAYTLICEYAPLLFLIGGLLGTSLLSYPQWNGALQRMGIDLGRLASQFDLKFDANLLRHTRWALFTVGAWFLLIGVASAVLGRREVFLGVEAALRYYVQQRHSFTAASYVVTAATTIDLPATVHPGDLDRWRREVAVVQQTVEQVDAALRPSWQGSNVRLELAAGTSPLHPTITRHVWRFGPHAYLIAEAVTQPGDRRAWAHSRQGLREFRALVGAIRSLVSVHGR